MFCTSEIARPSVSIAETWDMPVTRQPLVPPSAPRAPETMTFFGRLAAMRESVIGTWGQRAYEEDILQGRFFGHSSFILNTPDAIRHVLVDNYENYTRTPAGFRVLRPVLGEGLLIAEGRAWKHQRMALEIAGRTIFSFEMSRHGPTLRDFVMEYGARLARPHLLDLMLPQGWPSPQDFSRARFRKRWTSFVAMLMAERRAAGKNEGAPPRDLFDLMVAARDPETGNAFTDEQLGDQVATMILAGHETTATTLFWSLYLLALDPDTQEQLAAEVKGATINGAFDLDRLKFTRAVVDETMRLYPPAFLIIRAAAGPDTIDSRPVRKNDVVLIAPWILHRHEKLWREPNAFMPQ